MDIWNHKLHAPGRLMAVAWEYVEWMGVKNYSKKTIYHRQWHLGFFLKWCQERAIDRLTDITREVIENYRGYLCRHYSYRCKGPLSDYSRRTYMATVSVFFDWLVKKKRLLYSPVGHIRRPQKSRRIGNILTAREAESIISQPDLTSPYGVRDRAILETLYSTGIRRQELIDLTPEDIDMLRGTLIVKGKGDKERVVPIGERALKWVEKYLVEVRPGLIRDGIDTNALFLTVRGKPISSSGSLTGLMQAHVKAAGQRGSCHIFRRTMATLMLENGADVRYVQEMLGHARLSTTEVYTKVSIDKLKEVHRATHPTSTLSEPEAFECHPLPIPVYRCPFSKSGGQLEAFWQRTDEEFITMGNKYFDWMRTTGYSPRTVESSKDMLKLFIEWCRERSIAGPDDVTRAIIERYQSYVARVLSKKSGLPLSANCRKSRLLYVSGFFRWLTENDYVLYNPATGIDLPKVPKRLPRQILTLEEVEKIMAQPDLGTLAGIRDRAMLETLYATGVRRRELARLEIQWVKFEQGIMKVRGKGDKDRMVPLSERALTWIEKYANEARPLFHPRENEPVLFLNKYGRPFSVTKVSDLIGRYIKQAEIGKTGSCHLIRHTMATHMLENGADIRYLQELLGHNEISTTEIYTKVSIAKLKEVHTLTHPAQTGPTGAEQALDELE